ncbi:RsmB/NOP family class I SAM-dependent RNA methyltransferase [Haliangium ochraceum]|uniref:tRNA (Cytosine-5-)-methyltransferase n=1 Tax=Haliangium ochraceum (strain DSM 14365 / JCM 11303 / SMP-2) TaxID=502025 RepID=D0LKD1_HALO1|nr:RsmB/NOP family class I SAM-dependent RNA methyltransferase [Haliangium ochraceum]ACY13165.1 tRNA (cytosine-5-)-methyltransferase [Haliangium ochraceum DSM 14365]
MTPWSSEELRTVATISARYRELVDEWTNLRDALLAPQVPCLWLHPLRASAERVPTWLRADGAALEPMSWHPGGYRWRGARTPGLHWSYQAGLYHVQEEASMVPVALLAPEPGERILDLCAAPGNKTAQIALALGNRGTVVANDRSGGRLAAIQNAVTRLGLCNVSMTGCDGTRYPRQRRRFDKVLVDAPCTAEGAVRKLRPTRVCSDSFRRQITAVQRQLLARAICLTRPGGRIVYATCTFAPEENELVVDAVLRALPGAARLLPAEIPGLATAPGITAWQGRALAPELSRTLRLWPHLSDSGGFFCAVLERSEVDIDGQDGGPAESTPTSEIAGADAAAGTDHAPRPALDDARVAAVWQRHGVDADQLSDIDVVRGGRYLRFLAADHQPPDNVRVHASGLPAMPCKARQPRLSTAGALAFGAGAQRDAVMLEPNQVDDYRRGQTLALTPKQHAASGGGFVLVTHPSGAPLGIGLLRLSDTGAWLESEVAKGRQLVAEV